MKSKWPLFIAFALTMLSGLPCFFIKDSETDHHRWVMVQVIHIVASFAFVVLTFKHIKPFKKWYVKWKKPQLKHKSVATLMASVTCLALIGTGLALLLFIDGGDSQVGLVHFYIGVAFVIFCGWHCAKRWWLKSLNRPKR